jgi:hypothetical protein
MEVLVEVVAIGKREDLAVYREAVRRLLGKLSLFLSESALFSCMAGFSLSTVKPTGFWLRLSR